MNSEICLKNDIVGNRYVDVVLTEHAKYRKSKRSFVHIFDCLTKGDTTYGKSDEKYKSTPFVNTLTVSKDGKCRNATVVYALDKSNSGYEKAVVITVYY